MKMLFNKIVLFIAGYCSLISCNPFEGTGPSTIVSGSVKNFYTGNPIKCDVTIQYGEELSYEIPTYTYIQLKQVITDDDGTFGFKFQTSKEYAYYIDGSENNYYIQGNGTSYREYSWIKLLKGKKNERVDFLLKPIAEIRIIAMTQQPFTNNGDAIYITYPVYDTTSTSSLKYLSYLGILDITSVCPGDIYNMISWKVTRNNITQQFTDSIYLPAFQRTVYNINY